MSSTVRVGILGSRFISTIHAESLRMIPGAENLSKHASFSTAKQRKLFDVLSARYLA